MKKYVLSLSTFLFLCLCSLSFSSSKIIIDTKKNKSEYLNNIFDEKNIFFERILTEVRQNSKIFIVFNNKHCKIHIYNLKSMEYVKSIGHKGQGPTEFQVISDIYLTKNTIYALDGVVGKIISFSLTGKMKKVYKLSGPGENLAVDERNGIFIINDRGKNNTFFVNMETGKLIAFGSLPKLGNPTLDNRYFSLATPIVSPKHYILVRNYFPEIIILNKKKFKPMKNIQICPKMFQHRMEEINKVLEKGLGDKGGIIGWGGQHYIENNKVYILNLNYITILNLKSLNVEYKIFAEKSKKNENVLNYPSFKYFLKKGKRLFIFTYGDNEGWYECSLE